MFLHSKRPFIYWGIFSAFLCVCLSLGSCTDGGDTKKRVLLRSDSLSTPQVEHLANKHGFKLLKKIDGYDSSYLLVPDGSQASAHQKRDAIFGIEALKMEPMVGDVEVEKWQIRDPRGGVDVQSFSAQMSENSVINIHDPDFNKQWYLHNLGMLPSQQSIDINVLPVWNRGIDGSGVTVAILDDGIDYTNADIYSNYDRFASFDYQDMDEDPSPALEEETSHGTRCASIVAGSSNNYCGIGVAYNASIAGIRMLDDKTTDTIEADALSHKIDHIDIYSCNWGPRDDGTRFGGPGPLATKALHMGAQKGRHQLGSIYIWSSGNGGMVGDDCNADGYVTNLFTLAIGAISADGQVPRQAETCSSVIASTFSGSLANNNAENIMINSDTGNQCKQEFQGTSSAGSIATGIVALMLQANPSLIWRDVHHIIVETAQIVNPGDVGWKRNGAGKWFNPKYGFGRLDALEAVQAAYQWKSVDPKQSKCKIPFLQKSNHNYYLHQGGSLMINLNGSSCFSKGKDNESLSNANKIKKIEHVQLIVSLTHECRGRVNLVLISPSGTISPILKPRPKDVSSKGLEEWIFKSVHFWGESPIGQWTLVFSDSTAVDPCKLLNQTSGLPIESNATQRSNNTILPQLTEEMNNQKKTKTFTTTDNNIANSTLDSVRVSSTTTAPSESTSSSSPKSNDGQKDIKSLYNIINNINDISQKILKLQNNSNTVEADEGSQVATTTTTRPPENTANDNGFKKKSEDESLSEKFSKIDSSNNNTKIYERILLEKVKVGPDQYKAPKKKHILLEKSGKVENNKSDQAAPPPSSDVDDEELEVSGTNEEKDKLDKNNTRSKKSLLKGRFSSTAIKNNQFKRSGLNGRYKRGKPKKRHPKNKGSSTQPKFRSERRKIVGSLEALTLIIYGT